MNAVQLQINQNSLSIVEEQLSTALEAALEQLEEFKDLPDSSPLFEALITNLAEVGGIFRMIELPAAYRLVDALSQSLAKIGERQSKLSEREKEALFNALYMLPRYVEFATAEGAANPLLLSPAFYGLSSAGMCGFVSESELLAFSVTIKSTVPTTVYSSADQWPAAEIEGGRSLTFRRLRHMYQVGLIGMLRGENVATKLLLMQRAVERSVSLCEGAMLESVWQLLQQYMQLVGEGSLELTAPRRHFFARFDRLFKQLEQTPLQTVNQLPDTGVIDELALMLLLAAQDNRELPCFSTLINAPEIGFVDADLSTQRHKMERGTHQAFSSAVLSVRCELAAAELVLEAISESGICEQKDITALLQHCQQMLDALRMIELKAEAEPLVQVIDILPQWVDQVPETDLLLEVANIFLYLESALDTRSLRSGVQGDQESVVAQGLFEQAQLILFNESRANLSLAKRAITSYIESGFDKEHIANIASCLDCVRGAFSILKLEEAENMLARCSSLVASEYDSQSDRSAEQLENLADALVTTEYLLEELQAGRAIDGELSKLMAANLETLG